MHIRITNIIVIPVLAEDDEGAELRGPVEGQAGVVVEAPQRALINIYIYIYMHIYVSNVCMCIYIYIHTHRERGICTYNIPMFIYMYREREREILVPRVEEHGPALAELLVGACDACTNCDICWCCYVCFIHSCHCSCLCTDTD